MKILYVTHLWTGLREMLFDGQVEVSGMPAFLIPLKYLIEHGHEVEMICIAESGAAGKLNVGPEWLKKIRILSVVDRLKIGRLIAAWHIFDLTRKALKGKVHDVVFAHGPIAEPARLAARLQKVRFVHRLYGTFFFFHAEQDGWVMTALRRPFEFLSFVTQKDALIITNDGTRGDEVAKKLNNRAMPFKFYFLLNGTKFAAADDFNHIESSRIAGEFEDYIFVCARIERWKGQKLALELCKRLRDLGCSMKVKLAGQISDAAYYEELLLYVSSHGLEGCVEFMAGVPSASIPTFARNATFCFFNQSYSNLGNAFHEIYSAGGVILCRTDKALSDWIVEGESGFYFSSLDEAVTKAMWLLSHREERAIVSSNAVKRSKKLYMTWDERAQYEESIIADRANAQPPTGSA